MRFVVVGGGILGIAAARQLTVARPGAQVVVLEKEDTLAAHQSGRNSGVLHAGVYYPPGSQKAVLCTRGRRLLVGFCQEHDVPVRLCGKVVVARDREEQRPLAELLRRATANGVPDAHLIGPTGLAEVEPHVTGVEALHSPHTGVVDFAAVTRRLAELATAAGAEVRRGVAVDAVRATADGVTVTTDRGPLHADAALVCAGLQSDRVARRSGLGDDPAIVPFRGSWLRLAEPHAARVRALVYPVPDPRYPFLGVHLTRTIDDAVLAGPNALLALAREGYDTGDVERRDVAELLRWPGTWRMAARHWPAGVRELVLAASRRLYARQVSTYLPGVAAADLTPSGNGVRAQAVSRAGDLVDDFRIDRVGSVVMVRNAPSPAATSSLAIAEHVVSQLLDEPVQAPEEA